MTIEPFVTLRGLARRVRQPLATVDKRLKELGIFPCGIAVQPKRSTLLFRENRIPEIQIAINEANENT